MNLSTDIDVCLWSCYRWYFYLFRKNKSIFDFHWCIAYRDMIKITLVDEPSFITQYQIYMDMCTYPWLCISSAFQDTFRGEFAKRLIFVKSPEVLPFAWLSSSLYAQVTSAFLHLFGGRLISRALFSKGFCVVFKTIMTIWLEFTIPNYTDRKYSERLLVSG